MREFHAHPLPMGEDALPPKKTKPVTIPEPFQLELDERGVKRLQEFSQKVLMKLLIKSVKQEFETGWEHFKCTCNLINGQN